MARQGNRLHESTQRREATMKLAAWMFFITLALFPAAACAEIVAQSQFGDNNEFLLCQSYDECMIVWGGCSDVAINKNYANQFQAATVCDATSPHDPKAVPT